MIEIDPEVKERLPKSFQVFLETRKQVEKAKERDRNEQSRAKKRDTRH